MSEREAIMTTDLFQVPGEVCKRLTKSIKLVAVAFVMFTDVLVCRGICFGTFAETLIKRLDCQEKHLEN